MCGAGVSNVQREVEYTPEKVAEFLKGIGLSQYIHSFLKEEMNGELLLAVQDDDLMEIGVLFRLHQVKIITVFKRLVTGESPTGLDHVHRVIGHLLFTQLYGVVEA